MTKPSDVLKRAKNHLLRANNIYHDNLKPSNKYTYRSPYICDAIDHASALMDSNKAAKIGDDLRDQIRNAIGNYFSLQQWLEFEVGIHYSELTEKNMQLYRHRWLSHLIKEFKRAGK